MNQKPTASQAQVRAIDNQQVDRFGRTPAGPDADYFGDHRDTFHAQGQQTIDHLTARAESVADKIRAGQQLTPMDQKDIANFDQWFGAGTFREEFIDAVPQQAFEAGFTGNPVGSVVKR